MNGSRTLPLLLLVAALPAASGCSNLVVKKVPLEDRACGADDQKGFRYYMNRPYLLVKKNILISERKSLVPMNDEILKHLQNKGTSGNNRIASPSDNIEGKAVTANTQSLDKPSLGTLPNDRTLTGNVEIMYLPDLDEQYVIKSKNLLAKTALGLSFQDGSQLNQVQGEHDSTTVTVSLLEQVDKAIGAAQGVAQKEIERETKIEEARTKGTSTGEGKQTVNGLAQTGKKPIYQRIERVYIKAGMYRLNKPWEIEGPAVEPTAGVGFLAKLGLPTTVDVDYEPVAILGSVERDSRGNRSELWDARDSQFNRGPSLTLDSHKGGLMPITPPSICQRPRSRKV